MFVVSIRGSMGIVTANCDPSIHCSLALAWRSGRATVHLREPLVEQSASIEMTEIEQALQPPLPFSVVDWIWNFNWPNSSKIRTPPPCSRISVSREVSDAQAHERMEFRALSRTTCTYSATVSRGQTVVADAKAWTDDSTGCKGHPSIPALLCSPKETGLRPMRCSGSKCERATLNDAFSCGLRRHQNPLPIPSRGGADADPAKAFAKMFPN